jgi:RHS repeat-associated protein
LDEVGIWGRVLTEDEISWLYNNGSGRSYSEIESTGATPTPSPTPSPTPNYDAGWQTHTYSYEGDQPHAVTSVERPDGLGGTTTDSYTYDANGNMLTRVENGVTWTQTYNAQNRLASVSDGTDTWSFVYDGDGVRVKQVNPDGSLTLFLMGGLYTVEDAESGSPAITTTYTLAGQKVAVREGGALSYLVTDHLGSVIALLDGDGDLIAGSEQRYYPFGAPRMEASTEADWSFTGQRTNVSDFGLMDFNARFMSPTLGRFVQPDTIVPGGPQGLNRYSYVFSNPINLVDPSGHVPQGGHCADGVACDYGVGGSAVNSVSPGDLKTNPTKKVDVEINLQCLRKPQSRGCPSGDSAGLLFMNQTLEGAGINCGQNVDPLVCLLYTNPGSFDFEMNADFPYPNISNWVTNQTCALIGQGCVQSGVNYTMSFDINSIPGMGTQWSRYSNWGSFQQPLFDAVWSLEGNIATETFSMWGTGNYSQPNVSVILSADANNGDLIWSSSTISVNSGGRSNLISLPPEAFQIKFTTKQTGGNSIQTAGQLFLGGENMGSIYLNGTLKP